MQMQMSFTISYEPLWRTLQSRGMKKIDLVRTGFVTSAALKKLQNHEPVSLNVIGKICIGLGVGIEDVVEFIVLDGTGNFNGTVSV